MPQTVTFEIDDALAEAARKVREHKTPVDEHGVALGFHSVVGPWPDEAAFWVAVVVHGLDIMAALQEGDGALEESEKVQGPWRLAPPTTDDDIPF